MPDLAVVYLVPKEEPQARSFLDVYRGLDPGVDHQLILIANRWTGGIATWMKRLADEAHAPLLDVTSTNFDIDAYRAAAAMLEHDLLCLLNSYSRPLVDRWLALLTSHIASPSVGAVAATGSWESHLSAYGKGIPGTRAFGKEPLARSLRGLVNIVRLPFDYPPFPNYHLRSNAFAIARDLFVRLAPSVLKSKAQAERYESGRRGLSAGIKASELSILVAGRDGRAYEPSEFRRSHTFRIGQQCNLIVADNRTADYAEADPAKRGYLRELAWGESSDDQCPRCEERKAEPGVPT